MAQNNNGGEEQEGHVIVIDKQNLINRAVETSISTAIGVMIGRAISGGGDDEDA